MLQGRSCEDFYCGLFVSYRQARTHSQLSARLWEVSGGGEEGSVWGGSGEPGAAWAGSEGSRGTGWPPSPAPQRKEPLRFSGTCWQLSEGCHSFLCRVTRTGWNWFEADQLLNTMQSLSYYSGRASSLHGSQKQRSLQKGTSPKQYVNAHFRHTALVCG